MRNYPKFGQILFLTPTRVRNKTGDPGNLVYDFMIDFHVWILLDSPFSKLPVDVPIYNSRRLKDVAFTVHTESINGFTSLLGFS